jgi:hypothetical protein
MNSHPIPAVALSESDVAAVARLRADGLPWATVVADLHIPAALRPDFDLLPLFHPAWAAAYAEANRRSGRDAFAEAQFVTRQLLRYAAKSAVRKAATRRAGSRPKRSRAHRTDVPLVVVAGNALAYRLARGETLTSIGAAYLAGLATG